MKCEKVRKNLSAYVDGELRAKLRQRVGEHLSGCDKCAAEMSRLREVTRAATTSLRKVASAAAPPRNFRVRVMEAIELVRSPRRILVPARKLVAGTALVALTVGLGVGIGLELRFRSERRFLCRTITEQRQALAAARSDTQRTRRQLIAARMSLGDAEEKLRMALARGTDRDMTASASVGRWPPVLSSLQMSGASSLLENGFF